MQLWPVRAALARLQAFTAPPGRDTSAGEPEANWPQTLLPGSAALAEVASTIEREFRVEISGVELQQLGPRRRSTVYLLQAQTPTGRREFIAKAGPNLQRAAELANQARRIFASDNAVTMPRAVLACEAKFLVTERFIGPSLVALCCWSPLANPFASHARAHRAVARAGAWLRRFHAATHHAVSDQYPFRPYLDRRREVLDLLPRTMANRVVRLVESAEQINAVVPHGDFSPHNVLVDRSRICVIDFGISEWTHVTPAWDLASMTVGLETILSLSWRSPASWLPARSASLVTTFVRAYGGTDLCSPAYRAAACLRHLVGMLAAYDSSDPRDRTLDWHRAQIDRLLSQAG